MGKYFVYYGLDFLSPRALGRKWAEVIVDEIISSHYRFPIDYKAHQFELARQIFELDGGADVPWESERTVDVIRQYLEETGRDSNFRDDELRGWVERFRADKWAAARAYWDELRAGIAEAFAAGPGAILDQKAPGPAVAAEAIAKK